MTRIFLLSPASCAGRRAALLLDKDAKCALAQRLRSREGVPLGELFSFLSALYFRGKLAYAAQFARAPSAIPGALVITSNRGLVPSNQPVGLSIVRSFGRVPIDPDEPRYRRPLERDTRALACSAGQDAEFVLLGSIATGKYTSTLLEVFGDRLRFPAEFVGRGDMSRGGLLLRAAASGREMRYVPVAGAILRGSRPPRLGPRAEAVSPRDSRLRDSSRTDPRRRLRSTSPSTPGRDAGR